jgi:hypothetical protein
VRRRGQGGVAVVLGVSFWGVAMAFGLRYDYAYVSGFI